MPGELLDDHATSPTGAHTRAGAVRARRRWQRLLRENGLSLALAAMFLAAVAGQALAGHAAFNDEQREHGQPVIGLLAYLHSGHFMEALFENWESEFLQMAVFVLLAAKLTQKGSAESRQLEGEDPSDEDPRAHLGDPRAPWPVRRGGALLALYEHSLSIALFALFLGSAAMHAVHGLRDCNTERAAHGEAPLSLGDYVASARFWFESLQNWQSEFVAVLALVVLSIFLRERGSSQSKPVAAPNAETG